MRPVSLSRAGCLALLQAAPRLVLVWALLPLMGIARLRRWQGRATTKLERSEAFDGELWQRRVQALRRIGGRLPGCYCLARSIALSHWLNRSGHPNHLKIGVAGTAANLKSHSWVECNGKILDDTLENVRKFQKITEI